MDSGVEQSGFPGATRVESPPASRAKAEELKGGERLVAAVSSAVKGALWESGVFVLGAECSR